MLTRLDLRRQTLDDRALREVLPRAEFDIGAAVPEVEKICHAVRDRGAVAIRDYTQEFDRVRPPHLRVPAEVIEAAVDQLDPALKTALEEAIRRVRLVHTDQRRPNTMTRVTTNGLVAVQWLPVERVGLYVPGGRAVYPSSVIMNVVPAQVADVGSIAVASPPQADNTGVFAGYPNPTVLATCGLLGVDEVYAVGGAQAVAMFAYGARDDGVVSGDPVDCQPVAMVTGPGNVYVTAAKRLLQGLIGIDAEAGPTEIAILADRTANPEHVAADLISQAEHDPLAAAVLVTDDLSLGSAVRESLSRRLADTKHRERVETALRGQQSRLVLVDDLAAGLRVVNAYAPEHVSIQTADPHRVAMRVRNAGAVFVGAFTPVSLGDYAAGSNHVLPTAGSARHGGGLSVQTFLRCITFVDYSESALRRIGEHVITMAEAEDLPAHGQAIMARFDDKHPARPGDANRH